jgi:hypothetical protein
MGRAVKNFWKWFDGIIEGKAVPAGVILMFMTADVRSDERVSETDIFGLDAPAPAEGGSLV